MARLVRFVRLTSILRIVVHAIAQRRAEHLLGRDGEARRIGQRHFGPDWRNSSSDPILRPFRSPMSRAVIGREVVNPARRSRSAGSETDRTLCATVGSKDGMTRGDITRCYPCGINRDASPSQRQMAESQPVPRAGQLKASNRLVRTLSRWDENVAADRSVARAERPRLQRI